MRLSEVSNTDNLDKLIAALKKIAEHKTGSDEWENSDYFTDCQKIAADALKEINVKFINPQ